MHVSRIGSSNTAQPIGSASQRRPGVATLLKSKIPFALKKPIKSSLLSLRGMVGTKPDFLIIGAQRCGTTSLYSYLTERRDVLPASEKELHFFDYWSKRGSRWYYAQFPLSVEKYAWRIVHRRKTITGEASPSYLFHPHVPAKVQVMLPDAKLIALLRNPIDRAYSNYKYNVKVAYENATTSFEHALELEQERVGLERKRVMSDPDYYSFAHRMYSYKARGIYVDQLESWARYFPRN